MAINTPIVQILSLKYHLPQKITKGSMENSWFQVWDRKLIRWTWIFAIPESRHSVKNQLDEFCHCKENNWQHLLQVIKFKILSENYHFGKLVSTTTSLLLPNIKRICVGIDKCDSFCCYVIKCVSIWKICITLWANYFPNDQ